MYKVLILFLIFLSSTHNLYAQIPELLLNENFKSRLVQALDSVYNLQFEASKRLLKEDQKMYPNHPIWDFWDGLILWWTILPDLENTQYDNEFFYRFKKSDYESTRLLQKQPQHVDALILKIIANGFIARQHANRDEWIKSLQAARIGIESLFELKEIHPEIIDINFGEGLYEFYMDYLPKEYPFLKNITWLLPDGNKTSGLNKLALVADSGLFLRAESRYFLANIYQNYELDVVKSFNEFNTLVKQFPSNPFYAKRLIQLSFSFYTTREAIHFSDSLLQLTTYTSSKAYPSLQEDALLSIGKGQLKLHQFELAVSSLSTAFQLASKHKNKLERTSYGSICYHLGRTYEAMMQVETAKKWYRKAIETETSYAKLSQEKLNRK